MNRKLLLADESVTIRRVIELTFAGEGVDVVAVGDGEQAISRIPAEKPDIVLADIGAPKRSGYEVAAFIRQHAELSHVPVLLLAGAFEPVDESRARQVRCDGILVKPFEPHQVVARVRELLDARRTEARPPDPPSRGPDSEPMSLDEYFDRLDAAFAARGGTRNQPPASMPADDRPVSARVPTIEDVLGGASLRQADALSPGRVAPPIAEPAEASSRLAPTPGPPEAPRGQSSGNLPGRNPLAQAFSQLLAVEQGELDSSAITIGMVSPRVEITDELVDRVARRVLERLAPGAARNLVSEIVSEIAERLVHEEIQRIKKA